MPEGAILVGGCGLCARGVLPGRCCVATPPTGALFADAFLDLEPVNNLLLSIPGQYSTVEL